MDNKKTYLELKVVKSDIVKQTKISIIVDKEFLKEQWAKCIHNNIKPSITLEKHNNTMEEID